MKRQKNQAAWKTIYAQPLSNWWDALRREVNVEPMDDPLEPIMSVTNTLMKVRNAAHTARNIYLLPLALAWWLVAGLIVHDFYSGLSRAEHYANDYIQRKLEDSGLEHLSLMENERYANYYNLVKKNGKATTLNYYKYKNKYSDSFSMVGELIFFFGYLMVAIWLPIKIIRFPKHAEFHFDRERRIVYRWESGKVFGCRFENLGFVETKIGLMLFLYGENPNAKKGGYTPVRSVLQPTAKAYFNSADDNSYFMAQLLAFMEHGKQAIITGESFYRQPQFFFFEDKKPKDFEVRLNQVLDKEHELINIYAENAKNSNYAQ